MKQFRDGSFDPYFRQIESLLGIMGVKWPGEVRRGEVQNMLLSSYIPLIRQSDESALDRGLTY